MKLELPNGISLFLWEDEVEKIDLQDTQISIVRPSGRIVKISLSNQWLKAHPSRKLLSTSS